MKHAYLIMVHNEPYILEKSLKLIDDERNDIYIHVDLKWKDFDFDYFKKLIKKSNLYFTKRTDVRWGTYSQINCEMLLFEEASKNDKYAYYHLISGVDMPLTNQDEMHKFYDKHQGKEFICFDFHDKVLPDTIDRVKYYHIFTKHGRSKNIVIRKFNSLFYRTSMFTQRLFKVNRLKNSDIEIRKGANWISITDDLVRFIVDSKDEISKVYSKSLCADELFVQTLVYGSKFYKNVISKKNDDYIAIKRYVDWRRGRPYTFRSADFDELINSNCFFARKFSSAVDKEIIDKIYDYVRSK